MTQYHINQETDRINRRENLSILRNKEVFIMHLQLPITLGITVVLGLGTMLAKTALDNKKKKN